MLLCYPRYQKYDAPAVRPLTHLMSSTRIHGLLLQISKQAHNMGAHSGSPHLQMLRLSHTQSTILCIALVFRSVLTVMDRNGSIRNSYQYDPFGKTLRKSECFRNIFQYVGRYGVINDHEIQNLYMMRARHYDAEHGRFISVDPLG